MNRQTETFSFSPPNNLIEERQWSLGVSFCQTTNSVLNITDKNNSFSSSITSRWRNPNYLHLRIIDKLKNLLKLKPRNDIELN